MRFNHNFFYSFFGPNDNTPNNNNEKCRNAHPKMTRLHNHFVDWILAQILVPLFLAAINPILWLRSGKQACEYPVMQYQTL